ncbi:MAG: hypothetical protein KIS78_10480 [Labilithrix sp.]|nr:hypothetical protein [Labilithrix sp.]MCW5832825.1 hypothetical protein [Labilithrix sp.]
MTRPLELLIGIVSVAMFVGTLVAIPWFVRRLPADHFVRPPPQRSLAKRIAQNLLGVAFIAAGIAMLFLPGQGVVTILIGLSIVDLPVKHRVMRWLLQRPAIQEGVQRLRARAGKPPLVIPSHA